MSHLFVLAEFLFVCSLFILLPGGAILSCLFLISVALYHLVDLFCFWKIGIRLHPSLLLYCFRPRSFWASAIQLKMIPFLSFSAAVLGLVIGLFWQVNPFLFTLNPVLLSVIAACLGCLTSLRGEAFFNPLFLAQRDFVRSLCKQSNQPLPPFSPNEEAHFFSSDYPLLRTTDCFKGERLFDIQIEKGERPHLIFVVLESFRAKNVGCLGATQPLSPHFDALAQQGILFSNFHSTSTLTCRAMIAALFGILPAHAWWHMNRYVQIPLRGLPQILVDNGYQNALIQGGSVAFDYGFEFFGANGYRTMLGDSDIGTKGTSWGVYDEHLMPFAADWLAKQSSPTCLTLCTITNHHPWTSPPDWKETPGHPYFNTFTYTDHALGLLIEQLRDRGLLKKSILFIFGDHGQELKEVDFNCHLTQENVHVPLLIYAEGRIQAPKRIDTIASQVDLLPTILDLLQLAGPHHSIGKSLFRPSDAPIFFSYPYESAIQGCRQGDWKFLLSEEVAELYDLSIDPEEQNNVAHLYPAITQKLQTQTQQHLSFLNSLYTSRSFAPSRKQKPAEECLSLDLSQSLRVTDDTLIAMAKQNPNLVKIDLSHCVLLTDVGIRSLLSLCPRLEVLHIDGLDEITGEEWGAAPHLKELKALACPRFVGNRWLETLTNLQALHLESERMTDDSFFSLAESLHQLQTLSFRGIAAIQDRSLIQLFKANPSLKVVSLENCAQVSSDFLAALNREQMSYILIKDCPRMADFHYFSGEI